MKHNSIGTIIIALVFTSLILEIVIAILNPLVKSILLLFCAIEIIYFIMGIILVLSED